MPKLKLKFTKLTEFTPLKDHYKFGAELGKGKFSTVYKITYQGQIAAVRHLEKMNTKQEDYLAREIMILTALPRHVNIVQFYAPHSDGYVMEYAPNGNLWDALYKDPNQLRTVPFSKRLHFSEQILRAVEHLHHYEVVHNDIKEENILINAEGTLLLSDFGFAEHINNRPYINAMAGSPIYCAPEKILEQMSSKASDIYAVAILFSGMQIGSHEKYLNNTLLQFKKDLAEKKRPSLAKLEYIHHAYTLLIFAMWRQNKDERLNAKTALSRLIEIRQHYHSFDNSPTYVVRMRKVNMPIADPAGLLFAAVRDDNLDIVKLIFSHPDFQADWLTQQALHNSHLKVSPFLQAIRAGYFKIALKFLNHPAATKALLNQSDFLSSRNAILETVLSQDIKFTTVLLQHKLIDADLFECLFKQSGLEIWIKDAFMTVDNAFHHQLLQLITGHPLFTLRHLKITLSQCNAPIIVHSCPLKNTPFYAIYLMLHQLTSLNGNQFFAINTQEIEFAQRMLQKENLNVVEFCGLIDEFSENNPACLLAGNLLNPAVNAASAELKRRGQIKAIDDDSPSSSLSCSFE